MPESRRNVFTLLPGALLGAVMLTSCAGAPPAATVTPPAAPATGSPEPAAINWGYEGDGGPEHWGDLSPEFALCATGTEQTPIDLAGADLTDIPDVSLDYRGAPLQVVNNGHTIQVASDGASSITVDGATYELAQFHFHTPSEHTVDGESFDAELHLVHQDAENQLAVVGVLIENGAENAALASIVANLPAQADQETQPAGVTLDPQSLLPEERLTLQYSGSLTTPPCSEDVSWFVMTNPVEASAAQLAALEAVMGNNNRPLQPVNDRELLEDSAVG